MKVHELAKQQGVDTKELLNVLDNIGIKNKKSASVLTEAEVKKYMDYVEQENDKPEVALIKKKPKPATEPKKIVIKKKKKVVIVKKPHPPHPKEVREEKETVLRPAVKEEKKKSEEVERPVVEVEQKEEKKQVYKLKEKKEKKPSEKEEGKKAAREKKKYIFKSERKEVEEEEAHLDKLLQYKKKPSRPVVASPIPKEIEILETITVGELARKMNLKASDLISKLMSLGVMARINDQIDAETATLVAAEYGCNTKVISLYDETVIKEEEDRPEDLQPRPPVVTVMGHVDHGKTKLLDAIRNTNVADTEIGGITQHIGAYKVKVRDKEICFLDTPGHEAFTTMRARGAKVTDIVVLVVAADDGVMPQTEEAISHARDANVPIVVAINKIDVHGANPDKVRNELAELGVVPEEWGGDTLMVEVSALKRIGIEDLLETILLQAEMLDLKANPNKRASGTIIEAKIDKGRGIVGTVLVKNGTLKLGDPFVAGIYPGKVRAMFDENGNPVQEAKPSDPVEVIGFSGLPVAGDPFQVTESEKIAKQIGQKRQELKRMEEAKNVKKVTLENLYDQIKEGEIQEFKVIIKADVQGSVEALKDALTKLSNEKIRLNCIHSGVGAINESDVVLAAASNAVIIGFRVKPNSRASELAKQEKVDIKRYSIIYDVVDDVKSAMEGMLEPILREEVVGTAEVRKVFRVPKVGTVAGCYVTSGRISRNDNVRIMRDGIEIYSGKLASLKRFKDDVKEVQSGYECGLKVENYEDIKEGDQIEAFVVHKIAQKLDATV